MSSIAGSGISANSRHTGNVVTRFWEENVRGILFGVLYAMVKENSVGRIFLIASIVIEFIQMTIFCFRDMFHWSKIGFYFNLDHKMISWKIYEIIFWIVASALVASILNGLYIGYSFFKGEVRSIYLLRTMRWVMSIYTTVVYIPVLFILFAGISCDYSTTPPSLLLFPKQACWGGHTFMAIVAIVLSFIFCVWSLLCGLTYYEYDPNVPNSCGRLQNRFETVVLIEKMALMIVTVFLMDSPTAFVVISFVGSFVLVVAFVVMLPYYEQKFNKIRSGSFAGIFWINIGMVIAYNINNENNLISPIIGLVGLPFAIALGAFIADVRFKYLCDPALVDGYVSEELSSLPVKAKSRKKAVNWETPKQNKLLKNKLYSRLLFPWDVEIAARFVLVKKPSTALIDKAKAVYQTGMNKFPKSPSVLQAYANFMFTVVGDWQLGYVVLEKLRKLKTMLDIQFFIYRYDKDRERRTEGGSDRIGDFVDFMEYKKLQQTARRYHSTALVCIRKFWNYLLEPKVDVMQLSVLSNKIATAEKKASEHYNKLLLNHPKNVRVLRDYAKYLDEVVQDESGAQEMRKRADKYELAEMEKITDSHRAANATVNDGNISEGETQEDLKSDQSFDDKTVSSKSSGVRTRINVARLDKHNSLKALAYIMLLTTLFVMVVSLTELGIVNSQLAKFRYTVDIQNTAAGAAHTAVRIARGVADTVSLGPAAVKNPNATVAWQGTYKQLLTATNTSVTIMANTLRSIYWGSDHQSSFTAQRLMTLKLKYGIDIPINTTDHQMEYTEFTHKMAYKKKVETFLNHAIYNETAYLPDPTKSVSNSRAFKLSSIWSMSVLFMISTTEVLNMPVSYWGNQTLLTTKYVSLAYVIENFPSIATGMFGLVALLSENVSDSLDQLLLIIMVICIVTLSSLLVACLFIFRPIVQRIFTAKVRTFSMFTLIPTSVVKVMAKKRFRATSDHSDNERAYTDEELDEAENTKPQKWKKTPDTATETQAILHTPRQPPDIKDTNALLQNSSATTVTPIASPEVEGVKANASGSGRGGSFVGKRALQVSTDPMTPMEMAAKLAQMRKAEMTLTSVESSDSVTPGEPTTIDVAPAEEEETTDENAPTGNDNTKFSKLSKKMSALLLTLPGRKAWNGKKYKKVVSDEEEEGTKHTARKVKRHSRLDISSLRAVTRKLHLSYLVAMAFIIAALLIAYLSARVLLLDLVRVGTDLRSSDFRIQYTQNIMTDVTLMTLTPYNSELGVLTLQRVNKEFDRLLTLYNTIIPKRYQMDFLYTPKCPYIDNAKCPIKSTNVYYPALAYGFENLYFHFYELGLELTTAYAALASTNATNTTISSYSPSYIQFRVLGEACLDGFNYLTFLEFLDAMDKISLAKRYCGIITAVECVVFVLIYIFLFRPFVKQLREENEHTFSIIRMIPRKLIRDVEEIQEFMQETIEYEKAEE